MAYTRRDVPGTVQVLSGNEVPPTSTLVDAFTALGERAADAIVLRGYLGRSTIFQRALDYLERARRIEEQRDRDSWVDLRYRAAMAGAAPLAPGAPAPPAPAPPAAAPG